MVPIEGSNEAIALFPSDNGNMTFRSYKPCGHSQKLIMGSGSGRSGRMHRWLRFNQSVTILYYPDPAWYLTGGVFVSKNRPGCCM
jgi:hypothetical protein